MRARKRVQRHFGEEGGGDVSVARAKGSYLFDTRGKLRRLRDGLVRRQLRWGDPDLERRIERFRGPDHVYPEYRYRP